ncbi:hypothetical protein J4402_03110 [Candidatus Pacearchaeota archaeon]|nr:hypothetical protein [Candidatus Pacearchaeota archaeon]
MVKKKDEGLSLDDAFGDDEDVEYAESKVNKKLSKNILKQTTDNEESQIKVKSSKPIAKIKKGDKIKVDSLNLEVDAHIILIDHGSTKEMAIECFDPKTDKDYQIRYFSDQVERTIEFYELDEIIYNKVECQKIEW